MKWMLDKIKLIFKDEMLHDWNCSEDQDDPTGSDQYENDATSWSLSSSFILKTSIDATLS